METHSSVGVADHTVYSWYDIENKGLVSSVPDAAKSWDLHSAASSLGRMLGSVIASGLQASAVVDVAVVIAVMFVEVGDAHSQAALNPFGCG